MLNSKQIGDERMAFGLLNYPFTGIDENDCEIRRRGSSDHISGVLEMPGSIRDDEFAFRSSEVTISNIDGDPLFSLGF